MEGPWASHGLGPGQGRVTPAAIPGFLWDWLCWDLLEQSHPLHISQGWDKVAPAAQQGLGHPAHGRKESREQEQPGKGLEPRMGLEYCWSSG